MIDSSNRFFWSYPLKPATLFSLIHIRASSKVNDDGKFSCMTSWFKFSVSLNCCTKYAREKIFFFLSVQVILGLFKAPFKWWRQLHCRCIFSFLLFTSLLSGPEHKQNHNKSQFQIFFLRFYAWLIYVAFLSFSLNVKCKHLR